MQTSSVYVLEQGMHCNMYDNHAAGICGRIWAVQSSIFFFEPRRVIVVTAINRCRSTSCPASMLLAIAVTILFDS